MLLLINELSKDDGFDKSGLILIEKAFLFIDKLEKFYYDDDETDFLDLSYDVIFSMYESFLNSYNAISNSNIVADPDLSLKELHLLILIKSKQLEEYYQKVGDLVYPDYIIKYGEIIDEYHKDDDNFLKFNSSNQDHVKYQHFFKVADAFKIKIKDKESIINDINNRSLKWNQLLYDLAILYELNDDGSESVVKFKQIVIYDKSTVDWIENCKNESILSFIKCNLWNLTYGTFELANYVHNGGIGLYNPQDNFINTIIYYHVWFDAIKKSDFETMKLIQSFDGINMFSLALVPQKKELNEFSIVDCKNLIKYLHETDWNGFIDITYQMFFKFLVKVYKDQINEIPMLFLNNYPSILSVLKNAMNESDFQTIEILLNSSNIFLKKIEKQLIDNYLINYKRYLFKKNRKLFNLPQKSQDSIVELMMKFLSIFQERKEIYGYIIQDELLSIIVNYLFEKLLQVKYITMEKVKQINQLIIDHSIIVNHDIYHSFWYLHIKDIKYSFYLTSPFYSEIFLKNRSDYYDCSENNEDLNFIENYLDPSDFTLESIDNLSFDTILERLHEQMIKIINFNQKFDKIYSKCNKYINTIIEFCLIIRRVDLFKEIINSIKNQIQEQKENSFFFSQDVLFNSPFTALLSNSNLFLNQDGTIEEQPFILPTVLENFKKFEFQPFPFPLALNNFILSKEIIKSICLILPLEDIKSIIIFNFYQTSFHYDLLYQAINFGRFDIIKLIFDNFEINFSNLPIPLFNQNLKDEKQELLPNYSAIESLSFIFKNYFNLLKYPCKFKQIEKENQLNLFKFKFLLMFKGYLNLPDKIFEFDQFLSPNTSTEIKMFILNESFNYILSKNEFHYNLNIESEMKFNNIFKTNEYKELFKNLFIQKQQEIEKDELLKQHLTINNNSSCYCNYNQEKDNIFLTAFNNGDIQLCELILSYYPNYNFKITLESISKNTNSKIINYFNYKCFKN